MAEYQAGKALPRRIFPEALSVDSWFSWPTSGTTRYALAYGNLTPSSEPLRWGVATFEGDSGSGGVDHLLSRLPLPVRSDVLVTWLTDVGVDPEAARDMVERVATTHPHLFAVLRPPS